MSPRFSIIIPVFNRPDELDELLQSLAAIGNPLVEVIVVEDGSTVPADQIIEKHKNQLPQLVYHQTENQGPGPARNTGAALAKGEWLIFFDSDCIIPAHYFDALGQYLEAYDADCFGGPDRAHPDFTIIQKAISYAMTSILTTGGIRGNKKSMEKFKPRSYNLGIKREVFEKLNGFSNLRFGEDMDLSLRLEKAGFRNALFEECWVYHKRRTQLKQFYKQVFNSGMARIVLEKRHPGTTKLVHWLPAAFLGGLIFSLLAFWPLSPLYVRLYGLYACAVLAHATILNGSLLVGFNAVLTSYTQLIGYGAGFFYGWWKVRIKGEEAFAFRDNFYE